MQIEVIQVKNQTKISAKGKPFQSLEVAYKDLGDGSVKAKNIASFSEAAFKALVDAKAGSLFNVTQEKNDGGFWEWVVVVQLPPNATTAAPVATSSWNAGKESPEERAKKQLYIVRQSSLGHAVSILTAGAKAPPTVDAVLKTADTLVSYVMAEPTVALEDMEDDLPL